MLARLKKLLNEATVGEANKAPQTKSVKDPKIHPYAQEEKRERLFVQANRYQKPEDLPYPRFPEFSIERKTYNKFFEGKRQEWLDSAYEQLKPYHDFMVGYTCIAGSDFMPALLENIIKSFLEIYWDMPASENDHDSKPFGLVTHSLQTACANAHEVANDNIFDVWGMDSERSYKEKNWNMFAKFMIGLLHDSNKIFSYRLKGKKNFEAPEVHFIPLYGSILNFMLTYPTKFTSFEWVDIENPRFVLVPHYFFYFIPWDVQKKMPHYVYMDILTQLISYNSAKIPDVKAMEKEAKNPDVIRGFSDACLEVLQLNIRRLGDMEETPIYRLDNNWYAVKYVEFITELANRISKSPEYVTRTMFNAGLIGGEQVGSGVPVCRDKYKIYLSDKRIDSGVTLDLVFVKASFLENLLNRIYKTLQNFTRISEVEGKMPGLYEVPILFDPCETDKVERYCECYAPLSSRLFGIPRDKSKENGPHHTAQGQFEEGAKTEEAGPASAPETAAPQNLEKFVKPVQTPTEEKPNVETDPIEFGASDKKVSALHEPWDEISNPTAVASSPVPASPKIYFDSRNYPTTEFSKDIMPIFVHKLLAGEILLQNESPACVAFIDGKMTLYIEIATVFSMVGNGAYALNLIPEGIKFDNNKCWEIAKHWLQFNYIIPQVGKLWGQEIILQDLMLLQDFTGKYKCCKRKLYKGAIINYSFISNHLDIKKYPDLKIGKNTFKDYVLKKYTEAYISSQRIL
jgi:hypothetical protein